MPLGAKTIFELSVKNSSGNQARVYTVETPEEISVKVSDTINNFISIEEIKHVMHDKTSKTFVLLNLSHVIKIIAIT